MEEWKDYVFIQDDIVGTIRIRRKPEATNYAEFQCHKAEYVERGANYYCKYNWGGTGDETNNLDEACPIISGTVKWSGCADVNYGNAVSVDKMQDGYIHFCCVQQIQWVGKALEIAYEKCRRLLEGRETDEVDD